MAHKQVEKAFAHLSSKQRAYRLTFQREATAAQIVLNDLAKFCRAQVACIGADNDETNRLLGRNEVWHRVVQMLHLSDVELFALYAKLTTDQRQALFDPTHQVTHEEE